MNYVNEHGEKPFKELVEDLIGSEEPSVPECKETFDGCLVATLGSGEKKLKCVFEGVEKEAPTKATEHVIEIRYTDGDEHNPTVKFNNRKEDLGAVVGATARIMNKLTAIPELGIDGAKEDLVKDCVIIALKEISKAVVVETAKKIVEGV